MRKTAAVAFHTPGRAWALTRSHALHLLYTLPTRVWHSNSKLYSNSLNLKQRFSPTIPVLVAAPNPHRLHRLPSLYVKKKPTILQYRRLHFSTVLATPISIHWQLDRRSEGLLIANSRHQTRKKRKKEPSRRMSFMPCATSRNDY